MPPLLTATRQRITFVFFILGAATFFYLLKEFNFELQRDRLVAFGWGFAAIIPFQIFDQALNALGWRFAFPLSDAKRVPFWELIKVRVAGDGVNYLTPSGNLAGEFIRPEMLERYLESDKLISSVVLAKATQALGQALFVLLGLAWIIHGRLYAFTARQAIITLGAVLTIIFGVLVAVLLMTRTPPSWLKTKFPKLFASTAGWRDRIHGYLREHPGRLALSVLFFMLGYAWGALEIYLISRWLGLSVGLPLALTIEFLSSLIDATLFMVPAKIGTQEAGKTAIYAGLGLPPDMGFTVGLIRHIRELFWAGAGLIIYAIHRLRSAAALRRI